MLTALRRRIQLLLDVALSQAEDPQERIRALVADLRTRQAAGRHALGLTIALEKRLLDELVAAEDAALGAERGAKQALSRGDEGAAAELATRVLELQRREQEARWLWQEQRGVADRVRAAFAEASQRIDHVAHAHTILLARAHCAEATRAIAEALTMLESHEVRRQIERARGKVEALEG
jgi:phage shock protein A